MRHRSAMRALWRGNTWSLDGRDRKVTAGHRESQRARRQPAAVSPHRRTVGYPPALHPDPGTMSDSENAVLRAAGRAVVAAEQDAATHKDLASEKTEIRGRIVTI
jgi:hypothetical protein